MELTREALAPLIGEKIQLHGVVRIDRPSGRPTILIQERNAIRTAE